MIKIENPSGCSGCTACESICPKKCISMHPDGLGFLYPKVDETQCIDCNLCVKVCAFNSGYKTPVNFDAPIAYGARLKDIKEVEKSRSGGVFVAISDYILENGGVIYGVGMDSTFRVIHKRATSKETRDEFRGSKYVQSDIRGIFKEVEADLKSGRKVLFSGTPCQTAGLQSYLSIKHIDKQNLFVCDIVCHGVPSPYIWRDYLDYIRKKEGQEILGVNFRDKEKFGWVAHKESFKLADTYTYTYTYTFYQHIMFRHSCGVCHYTNLRRTGDITLADFWGWEKTSSTINNDDKGLSLILINTSKGAQMLENIKDKLFLIPTSTDQCLQPNLQYPSKIHPNRNKFEVDYTNKGFLYAMRHNGLMGWRKEYVQVKAKIRRMVKSVLLIIKSILYKK